VASRSYGYRRSPEDKRDKLAAPPELILSEVDLRDGPMPLVFDQEDLGSCTSQAVAACLQYDLSLDLATRRARRRSRLDIYYGERSLEGQLGNGDTGAYGRDGFKFAQQTGCLLEVRWPYDTSMFEDPPPSGYKRYKLGKRYASVTQDVDHVKAVLSNGQLMAFGFKAYESFESDSTARNGLVLMPKPGEMVVGGHEMVVCGYLADEPAYALVRNSWGSGWGDGGYCLFPWAYLIHPDLADDLRTIVRPTT
jgi:C1A family cysteine protease